jgi:shikimate dehydrogenase
VTDAASTPFVPDGKTRPYAVIGHPIGHTLSPAMHNAAFRALGRNAVYLALDIAPEDVTACLRAMSAMGFGGVNVTVPHKETVFRGLERLDDSARRAGAVNTVQFAPEGLVGYSTDGEGFLRAMREAFGRDPAGLAVFVLGAGGAGRTVALECARAGAASVTVSDVDAVRAERLAAEIGRASPGVRAASVAPAGAARAAAGCGLVVQATPVGMRAGDEAPLPPEAFGSGALAFDLVYGVPETPFMRAAAGAGAKASNGLGMLLHQGARSFEIWTGIAPPVDVMRAALEKAVYG